MSFFEDIVRQQGGPLTVRQLLEWQNRGGLLPCEVPQDGTMPLPYLTYQNHAPECACDQCTLELRGQFFFCDLYACCDYLADKFVARVVDNLASWLPRSRRTGRRLKPSVFGRVDSTLTCGATRIWLCRVFVALPAPVVWNRLWEKLLGKRDSKEEPMSLTQLSGQRDWIDVTPWVPDGTKDSFALFYNRCSAAICLNNRDEDEEDGLFGDETAVCRQCHGVSGEPELLGRL